MSYLSQMAGLAWHNFTSAAAGLGVALALARGLTRKPDEKGDKGVGNFWVDLIRAIVYVLLPSVWFSHCCWCRKGWCRPSLVTITSRPWRERRR